MNTAIAVKAFIVHEGQVLLLKRRPNDVHSAGKWDIPGGRLDDGEDPFAGLARETQEEAGLEVRIIAPIDVHHFTRDDGQKITMIIFWCTPQGTDVKLSEEHVEFVWLDAQGSRDAFPTWLHGPVERFQTYFSRPTEV